MSSSHSRKETAQTSGICRRFAISPPTAYQLLDRYETGGKGLVLPSARAVPITPRTGPLPNSSKRSWRSATAPRLGRPHDTTGLARPRPSPRAQPQPYHGDPASGTTGLPPTSQPRAIWQRFEHAQPNDLWQMDFKGHFATGAGRCHHLELSSTTIPADAIVLEACGQRAHRDGAGMPHRRRIRTYGLPVRMLRTTAPLGALDALHPRTPLPVWLMRLGIKVSHGAPLSPANAGQGRAFPPDAQCRGAPRQILHRLPRVSSGIRLVARRLQHGASAPGVWALRRRSAATRRVPGAFLRRCRQSNTETETSSGKVAR